MGFFLYYSYTDLAPGYQPSFVVNSCSGSTLTVRLCADADPSCDSGLAHCLAFSIGPDTTSRLGLASIVMLNGSIIRVNRNRQCLSIVIAFVLAAHTAAQN
ncbi:hypothetical protein EVAR_88617_1 [Eumeta japonica]|uniref:Uncharacterized protein n=1 Tax=Eumeta variegata TaxID=151549 RepID=A0A4C1WZR2_EUMVA|nr:hypothetical protein EVAR_88617_1 [Eumeta japonica]